MSIDEFSCEPKKKKNKNRLSDILGVLWIIAWFLCIWIEPFRSHFFLTGLFCLALGLILHDSKKDKKDQLEKLANLEHEQWIDWSKEISSTENISEDRRKRWQQYWIPYEELPDNIKEDDRKYARKVMKIIEK